MARGKKDYDIRANLSGRGGAPQRPVVTPLDPADIDSMLDEYADKVRALDELALDLVRRTPALLREAADKIFAANPTVMALCFTEEADPYYDENCRMQLGDRWAGGGMLVRGSAGVGFAPDDHAALPLSRRLIANLSDQALTEMYGSDGHAVIITRAGTMVFDMDGELVYSEPSDDPDREALLRFCESAGRY